MKVPQFLLLILCVVLTSCAGSQGREDMIERRARRLEARQERTDDWFDRKMGISED